MFYYPEEKLVYVVADRTYDPKLNEIIIYFDLNSISFVTPEGNISYYIFGIDIEYVEKIPVYLRFLLNNTDLPLFHLYFQGSKLSWPNQNVDIRISSWSHGDAASSTFAQLYYLYKKNFYNVKHFDLDTTMTDYVLTAKRKNGTSIPISNWLMLKLMITHLQLKDLTKSELPNNYQS